MKMLINVKFFLGFCLTTSIMLQSSVDAAVSPLTPELAAKQENYRKQKAQQHITNDQRKAAASVLKAERAKVYQARQAVKKQLISPPVSAP